MGETSIFKTVNECIDTHVRDRSLRDAVVFVDENLRLSWKLIHLMTDRLSKGFLSLGLLRGDQITIWSSFVPQWMFAQIAAAKIGAQITMGEFNDRRRLVDTLETTNLLIIHESLVGELLQLIPKLQSNETSISGLSLKDFPLLKNVIVMGGERPDRMYLWSDLVELAEDVSEEQLRKAKRQVLDSDVLVDGKSQRELIQSAKHFQSELKLLAESRVCLALDLPSINLMLLSIGASVVIPSSIFNLESLVRAIDREDCRFLILHGDSPLSAQVPTTFQKISDDGLGVFCSIFRLSGAPEKTPRLNS